MARRTNYSFEKNQRARDKAAKREAKREAKAAARQEKKLGPDGEEMGPDGGDNVSGGEASSDQVVEDTAGDSGG